MADDVMDSGERTEAALAAFTGEDTVDPNAGAQGDDKTASGAEGQGGEDQSNAREQQAADPNAVEGQLTDEQRQSDPVFQELSTFKDNVVSALSDFPGLVDDNGNVNVEEAGLQLKDASVLYDIMQGKGTPSALLEVMAQNAGWTPQQKQLVAQDLIGWLTKSGYLKDGAVAAAKKPGDPGFKDPVQERLDKIENDRKTEKQQAEQQRIAAHQQEVFEKKFLPEMTRLCKQKGIPQEDVNGYVEAVARRVSGNKQITARIEKGNFVDINKFFTEHYNSEVKRLQRWTAAQTKAAAAKNKNPRIPAGGAPPNPGSSANKANPKDRESRIAAGLEML